MDLNAEASRRRRRHTENQSQGPASLPGTVAATGSRSANGAGLSQKQPAERDLGFDGPATLPRKALARFCRVMPISAAGPLGSLPPRPCSTYGQADLGFVVVGLIKKLVVARHLHAKGFDPVVGRAPGVINLRLQILRRLENVAPAAELTVTAFLTTPVAQAGGLLDELEKIGAVDVKFLLPRPLAAFACIATAFTGPYP